MYKLAKKTRKGLVMGKVSYNTLTEARSRKQYFYDNGTKMLIVDSRSGEIVE